MPPEKISGLIVEGTKSALPNPYIRHYQNLIHQGIPVVFIHNYYNGLQTPCVLMDDIQASKKLTQMFLDAGHTKIAGIFKEDDLQGIRRFQGYAETLCRSRICRSMTATSGGSILIMKCGSKINIVLSIHWMI